MNRHHFSFAMVLLLAGCSTPQPVVDTATLVAGMAGEMDRTLTQYVGTLKRGREQDEQRLQRVHADEQLFSRALEDEIQIMTLAEEVRPLKVIKGLAAMPVPDPLKADEVSLPPITSPAPKFDGAPLKSVAKIATDLAKPQDSVEQARLLFNFAKTVNDDLKKAATATKATP